MTMRYPLYQYPFGAQGDLTAIPVTTQTDGSLSYQQGWGADYQRDQTTDPLAKDIDRRQMNQIFNSLTSVLREWQTETFPEFIASDDNGGSAFPYDAGTIVRWRPNVSTSFANYISLVAANTATPSDATKWAPASFALKNVDNAFTVAQTVPAGSGAQAMQYQQAVGRLIGVRVFATPGSSTYTPTAGTTTIIVEVQGGGGAGGGAQQTASNQIAAGAGGAAGGYAKSRLTSGFNGATIVVGAGGTGVTGGAGGSGTASSFGGIMSGAGGSGGSAGGAVTTPSTGFPNGGAGGGTATGGNLQNSVGGHGLYAFYGTTTISGTGGISHFGAGGVPASGTSGGNPAQSPGGGGGGACLNGAFAGGAGGGSGAAGIVVIYEYA